VIGGSIDERIAKETDSSLTERGIPEAIYPRPPTGGPRETPSSSGIGRGGRNGAVERHAFRNGATLGHVAAEVRSMAFRLATEAASSGRRD
jgi:hypothetical protein